MRKTFAACAAVLLLLTGCDRGSELPVTESASRTASTAATAVSITTGTTASPYVPQVCETEWGWYEISDPRFADYTFSTKGQCGKLYSPTLSEDSVALEWDSDLLCLTAPDRPGIPAVTCSLRFWETFDGSTEIALPAFMEAPSRKAVCPALFPETVSEYLTYIITHYEDEWDTIPALYLSEPHPLLPEFPADSSLLTVNKGVTEAQREMWMALLLHVIYTNPYTYNIISANGIDLEPCTSVCFARPVYAVEEDDYLHGLDSFRTAWEAYMEEIRAQTQNTTALEAALIVANYICAHCTYDAGLTRRSIQSGLLEGSTVCMGYTQWFNATMQALGFRVTNIMSNSLEHVWSAVYLPEEARWAEIDVTWMDGSYFDTDGANSDCIDIRYFDFCSRDAAVYPRHCCDDQESIIGMFTNGTEDEIYTAGKGRGYYFADVNYAFCKEIIAEGGGVFSLVWNTGEVTTLQLY